MESFFPKDNLRKAFVPVILNRLSFLFFRVCLNTVGVVEDIRAH